MSFGTQAKLLRVLEGHPFERVGGSTPIRVDVRVVAATNQPLEQASARRHVPPRPVLPPAGRGDPRAAAARPPRATCRCWPSISSSASCGRRAARFAASRRPAMKKMEDYHWPGNVRELRNVIERAVALGRGPILDVADIWLSSLDGHGAAPSVQPGRHLRGRVAGGDGETPHPARRWSTPTGTRARRPRILQIERSTLDRKIKGYGLAREGRGLR